VVYPHDICPVDGTVVEDHDVMNEAFLTGEPFEVTKAPRIESDVGRGEWRISAHHYRHTSGAELPLAKMMERGARV
jgi:magnesium-transporting ATPase (P-type)